MFEREARVFGGEEGLLCKSFNLFKILQEGRRKKARPRCQNGTPQVRYGVAFLRPGVATIHSE